VAARPLVPLIERAELEDLDVEASPPNVLEDRAEVLIDPDAADCCASDIPLVEEAESVLTEVDALLAPVRPEVDAELALLCCENFEGRCPEAFADSSEILEMLRGSRDTD
jgi:hypothetical protein